MILIKVQQVASFVRIKILHEMLKIISILFLCLAVHTSTSWWFLLVCSDRAQNVHVHLSAIMIPQKNNNFYSSH